MMIFGIPGRLTYGLIDLAYADLISSSQCQINLGTAALNTNDYATPSGWLLRHQTQKQIGMFDEDIKYHVDAEYLGRVNALNLRRLHQVALPPANHLSELPVERGVLTLFLQNVASGSALHCHNAEVDLVIKHEHLETRSVAAHVEPVENKAAIDSMFQIVQRYGTHSFLGVLYNLSPIRPCSLMQALSKLADDGNWSNHLTIKPAQSKCRGSQSKLTTKLAIGYWPQT